jgi:hypothetical protein
MARMADTKGALFTWVFGIAAVPALLGGLLSYWCVPSSLRDRIICRGGEHLVAVHAGRGTDYECVIGDLVRDAEPLVFVVVWLIGALVLLFLGLGVLSWKRWRRARRR